MNTLAEKHDNEMRAIYPNRLRIEELVSDPPNNAEICDSCQGWGLVSNGDECETCSGSGWIIPSSFVLAERAGQQRLFNMSGYARKWWQDTHYICKLPRKAC